MDNWLPDAPGTLKFGSRYRYRRSDCAQPVGRLREQGDPAGRRRAHDGRAGEGASGGDGWAR
jgi:hypothetical protein